MRTPRRFERRAFLFSLVVLLLSLAGRARAQNQFVNPEFDNAQLNGGWTLLFGQNFDWTGVDADDCPESGAAQLPSSTTDVGTQYAQAAQCIPIDSVTWPDGAHIAFSYSSLDAERVYPILMYYTSEDCGQSGGTQVGIHYLDGPVGPGWQRAVFDDFEIPVTAQSVWAGIGAEAATVTPIELLFDRAWLGKESPVFVDDFERGAFCRWSLTAP